MKSIMSHNSWIILFPYPVEVNIFHKFYGVLHNMLLNFIGSRLKNIDYRMFNQIYISIYITGDILKMANSLSGDNEDIFV